MVKWQVILSQDAQKDAKKLSRANLAEHAKYLLDILSTNPFQTPPRYEKLVGNLSGFYSRRINIQHRIVYSVDTKKRIVKIHRMWTHYE